LLLLGNVHRAEVPYTVIVVLAVDKEGTVSVLDGTRHDPNVEDTAAAACLSLQFGSEQLSSSVVRSTAEDCLFGRDVGMVEDTCEQVVNVEF